MTPNPSQNFQINIIQGATLMQTITYYDYSGNIIDLTGYTANMQWRSTVEDTGTPIISLSTSNGLIIISGVKGEVTYIIPSYITSTLSNNQLLKYNLFLTSPGGIVTALLGGQSIVEGTTIR
jgi:hypothetical protein